MSIPFLTALWAGSSPFTLRPTSAAYTGTTPTNPTYAYDDTGTSTWSTLFTGNTTVSTQTYTIDTSAVLTAGAVLTVVLHDVVTMESFYGDPPIESLISSVAVAFSIDGGSAFDQTFDQTSSWGAGTPSAVELPITLTATLAGNYSSVVIRIGEISNRRSDPTVIASVQCDCADITLTKV